MLVCPSLPLLSSSFLRKQHVVGASAVGGLLLLCDNPRRLSDEARFCGTTLLTEAFTSFYSSACFLSLSSLFFFFFFFFLPPILPTNPYFIFTFSSLQRPSLHHGQLP